jgi:mRNA interferase MazF
MTTGTELARVARGEIWLAALGNARRGEVGKSRPVVVVAADGLAPYGPTDLVPVVPLSSSRAPSPSRVPIRAGRGLEDNSVAVCRAVRGIGRARLLKRLGVIGAREQEALDQALSICLGLG